MDERKLADATERALIAALQLLGDVVKDEELFESIEYNIKSMDAEDIVKYVLVFGQPYEDDILNLRVDSLVAGFSMMVPSIYEISQDATDAQKEKAGKILRVLYNVGRKINSAANK